MTFPDILGRVDHALVPQGRQEHSEFHRLPNKKNRNSFEAKLTSSVANVYTHTNTNFNTQKRRGKMVVPFASAYRLSQL